MECGMIPAEKTEWRVGKDVEVSSATLHINRHAEHVLHPLLSVVQYTDDWAFQRNDLSKVNLPRLAGSESNNPPEKKISGLNWIHIWVPLSNLSLPDTANIQPTLGCKCLNVRSPALITSVLQLIALNNNRGSTSPPVWGNQINSVTFPQKVFVCTYSAVTAALIDLLIQKYDKSAMTHINIKKLYSSAE